MEPIKRILQSIFGLAGYQMRRIKPEANEDFVGKITRVRGSMGECLKHLTDLGFQPNTVVDVGVGFGTPELYEAYPQTQFLLVEPVEEFQPFIDEICARYRVQAVLAAAGPENGTVEFCVTPDKTTSAAISPLSSPELFQRREVKCVRVDDLCTLSNYAGPFLIKVDVQGFELSVLQGCTTILPQTEAIILEVNFFPFSKGIPDFHDVITYMKSIGFVAFDIYGGHNRPLDMARAQADVLFVKENGRFRSRHEWGSEAQKKAFLECKRQNAAFAKIMSET